MSEQIPLDFENPVEKEIEKKLNPIIDYLSSLIRYEELKQQTENQTLTITARLAAGRNKNSELLGAFRSISRNASFKSTKQIDDQITAELAYPIGDIKKIEISVTE